MLHKSLNFLRKPLVSTTELAGLIATHGKDVRIVNSTLTRPLIDEEQDYIFQDRRIPNASFVNIMDFCNHTAPQESQIPQPHQLGDFLEEFDLRPGDIIVSYDDLTVIGAARFWWILKTYGIQSYVLDGGFNKWVADGHEVEEGAVTYSKRQQTAQNEVLPKFELDFDHTAVLDFEDVNCASYQIRHTEGCNLELVDARAAARFQGTVGDHREGLRSRNPNIPGSKNVPFSTLLNEDTTYKSDEEIKALFEEAGVDLNKEIVSSCGSGLSACLLQLGLAAIGQGTGKRTIYDGSWSEYGKKDEVGDEEISRILEQKKADGALKF